MNLITFLISCPSHNSLGRFLIPRSAWRRIDGRFLSRSCTPSSFFSRPEQESSDNRNKSKSPVDAYTRRRQQVRRAQAKHRLKKENYISALEREVTRLRETVARQTDPGILQREIQELRQLLAMHGIPPPPSIVSTISTDYQDTQESVQVSLMEIPNAGDFQMIASTPSPLQAEILQTQSSSLSPEPNPGRLFNSVDQPVTLNAPGGSPDRDINVDAFDFVMRLEQPCLAHVHPQDGSPQATGHTLSLQSAALAFAPSESGLGSSWQVPVREMKRLLDLSEGLPLTGELTPIQAWARLANYPILTGVKGRILQELASHLSGKVQCYGFGAVIDEQAFLEVLGNFLRR